MSNVIDARQLFARRQMIAKLSREKPTYALALEQWLNNREATPGAADGGGSLGELGKIWSPDGERT